MIGFLDELGKLLTTRRVAMLVLPGLLFTSTATVASVLGQVHWADGGLLWRRLNEFVATGSAGQQDNLLRTIVILIVLLVAVLASSLAAKALAGPVEHFLVGKWPPMLGRLAGALMRRRQNAWTRLDREYRGAEEPDLRARLASSRNRIALVPPQSPTWIGDRLCAPAVRVHNEYGLGLSAAWPRLWLLLPDNVREPLSGSRRRFDEATCMVAWSILYLVLGAVWWPSAILGVCTGVVAWRRARAAADVYAELVEATVDLYVGALLDRFTGAESTVKPQMGKVVTERFRKGT